MFLLLDDQTSLLECVHKRLHVALFLLDHFVSELFLPNLQFLIVLIDQRCDVHIKRNLTLFVGHCAGATM